MKRYIAPLMIVVVLAVWIVSPAKAHANLIRSVPEAGAVLAQSPTEIVLEFSETLDPAVARVELLDSSGQVVIPGPGVVDTAEPSVLRLQVGALPDGTYSAVWRVRSAVDGHVTSSSVGFSIGEASPLASLLPPPGTPDPATRFPSTPETIARWFAYLSAAVAAGSLTFGFLIWRPAYRQELNKSEDASEEADEAIRRAIRRLALGSLVSLGIATFGFAIIQTAQALELSIWETLSTSFSQLFSVQIGMLLGVRLLLILILGGFVVRLPSPGSGSSVSWWMILILASLILFTFSLSGHGAARGSIIGVVIIWLHLAAMTVWLGGLPMLFLALRRNDFPASTLVPRFSEAALISVGIITATGVYNAFTYVRSGEALIATTYGRSLIVKTGIFALLYALGTVNLFYLSPKLREASRDARKGLFRTVRTEMILGIFLLLAVGVLSGVSPAFEALEAHQEQGIIESARVDGVNMMLRVVPGEGGDNEIGVEFTDTRPGATEVPPEVLLRLTSTAMDMGTQQVETTSKNGFRYTARGSYFPMLGPWELEVIIRRPGFNDVRQTFELEIQDQSSP
jgi:copper transport protein